MNVHLGELIHTAGFVLPHNPVSSPNIPQTGNPVAAELSMGCMSGAKSTCSGRINGMGEFELPLVGVTVPGSQWMYLLALGAAVGVYMMSRKGK